MERYDLILDAKTTRSPWQYLRALKPSGRYVTVGGQLPQLLQIVAMAPLVHRIGNKALRILALKPNKGLTAINDLFAQHSLRGLIDGPYALADVPRALQRFGQAQHIGKIVITVA